MAEEASQDLVRDPNLVTYEDIYLCFTEDEWALLNDDQKRLYFITTLDNFLLAASVGLKICCYEGVSKRPPPTERRVNITPPATDTLKDSSGPSYGHALAGENVSSEHDVSRKVSQVRALKVDPSIQKSHQCDMCDPILKSILHVAGQKQISPGQQPYPCRSCGTAFWVSVNRDKSPRQQSGETLPNVENDQAPSSSRYMLYSSEAFSRGENGNAFLGKPGLLQHHATQKGESYRHTECEEAFHTEQKHDNDSKYREAFSHKGTNNQRQNMVMGAVLSHKCMECGELFRNISSLNVHQKVHTTLGPYKCTECEKTFFRKCNLVQHHKYHHGPQPYNCDGCGKAFSRKDVFLRHRKINSREKPLRCSVCEKTFLCKDALAEHQNIHPERRMYTCDECGQRFTLSTYFNIHKRIHNTARFYRCSECGKTCINNSRFKQHMKIHTTARRMGEVNVGEPTENAPTSRDI